MFLIPIIRVGKHEDGKGSHPPESNINFHLLYKLPVHKNSRYVICSQYTFMNTQNRRITFQMRRRNGPDIKIGTVSLHGESVAVVIRWGTWGFIWNYPLAVTIDTTQEAIRYCIINYTHLLQVGLWIVSGYALLKFFIKGVTK